LDTLVGEAVKPSHVVPMHEALPRHVASAHWRMATQPSSHMESDMQQLKPPASDEAPKMHGTHSGFCV